jgi:AcrR family transcriptional regulator
MDTVSRVVLVVNLGQILQLCPKEARQMRQLPTKDKWNLALVSLMLLRGWEYVEVLELCQKAGVSRSTFYLHFQNKEELLEYGFSQLRLSISNGLATRNRDDQSLFYFVGGVADHIFQNRQLFLALVGGNSGGIVRQKFCDLVCQLATEELGHKNCHDPALINFMCGGFVSLAAFTMKEKNCEANIFKDRFNKYAAALLL